MTYKAYRGMLNQEKRVFDGVGGWDIPNIKPTQNNYEPCPFIGFNFAKGYKNPERVGVHFFLDDYQFERVWNRCETYTELLKRFKYVLSPEFSIYTDFPLALQLYNHFRKQWLGAYWQENGVNVIPTVVWGTEESYSFCFDGIPTHSTIAVSAIGTQNNRESRKMFDDGYKEMLRRLEPEKILFYGKVPENCTGNIEKIEAFQERFEHGKR